MANYSKKNRQAQDKYYTKPETAKMCYELLKKHLKGDYVIIEPAAGDGKLMDAVDNTQVYGFDLFPEREDIVRNDFLEFPSKPYEVETDKTKVTFANPPFGTRGAMCKTFIDEALNHSDIIGFIVPNSFKTHCKKYHVVDYLKLPANGFTYADDDYEVNCYFVVITNNDELESKTEEFLHHGEYKPTDKERPNLTNDDFVKGWVEYKIAKIRLKYGLN